MALTWGSLASKIVGPTASIRFENTMPVIRSILSRLMKRSVACLVSGFCWSSAVISSTDNGLNLPPACLSPSAKPSRMSTPARRRGPESVVNRPT